MPTIRALAATTLAILLGAYATPGSARPEVLTLEHDGERRVALVEPASKPRDMYPVVLVFHGGNGRARGMRRVAAFHRQPTLDRFILVYPQAAQGHWNDGRETTATGPDDVGYVFKLLRRLETDYRIDPRRVFIAGVSNGGLFVQRLACEHPARFAGAASVIATQAEPVAARCAGADPLPMLMVMATSDPFMPWSGGEVKSGRSLGKGGRVIGAPRLIESWRRRNGCGLPVREVALPDSDSSDDSRATRLDFPGCAKDTPLRVYRIDGGGHNWPGTLQGTGRLMRRILGPTNQDLNASAVIAEFFSKLLLDNGNPSPGDE